MDPIDSVHADSIRVDQRTDRHRLAPAVVADKDPDVADSMMAMRPHDQVTGLWMPGDESVSLEPFVVTIGTPPTSADLGQQACLEIRAVDESGAVVPV